MARQKNQTPLPLIKPYTGPRLPPDRYCLTAPNYRLKTVQKKVKNQRWLGYSHCLSLLIMTLCLCLQVSSTASRISVPRLSVGAVSSRPSTPTLGEQPGSESSAKDLKASNRHWWTQVKANTGKCMKNKNSTTPLSFPHRNFISSVF